MIDCATICLNILLIGSLAAFSFYVGRRHEQFKAQEVIKILQEIIKELKTLNLELNGENNE